MCSLLSLPRELRDQIIEHVVLFHKAPPQDPTRLQSRVESSGDGTLRLPALSQETYNASGLLGTSRQIRDETRYRLSQLNPPYSLDVMIGDNELWPTWTCCPTLLGRFYEDASGAAPPCIRWLNSSYTYAMFAFDRVPKKPAQSKRCALMYTQWVNWII
jgi:hypothetical protein